MANTFKSAATGSSSTLGAFYTCPASTTAVVHAVYLSNVDGTNDATIDLSVSCIMLYYLSITKYHPIIEIVGLIVIIKKPNKVSLKY